LPRESAGREGKVLLGFAACELSVLAAGALKLTTNELVQGPLGVLVSWPPYVLLFLVLWGLTLNQRVY
jgi:hypothetical protein